MYLQSGIAWATRLCSVPLLGCRVSFARLDKTSLRLRYFFAACSDPAQHVPVAAGHCTAAAGQFFPVSNFHQ